MTTFLENLMWRNAIKKFNNTAVSEENIIKIKNAIRFAPSSFGLQPYHIVVVSDKVKLQELRGHAFHNEDKFDTCSHMFVFCRRFDVSDRVDKMVDIKANGDATKHSIFSGFKEAAMGTVAKIWLSGKDKHEWTRAQTYIALGFGLAACAELMVDSCPMEGFNAEGFSKILNLPEYIEPVVLMAVGYRDDEIIYPKARFSEEDLFTNI